MSKTQPRETRGFAELKRVEQVDKHPDKDSGARNKDGLMLLTTQLP